MPNEPNTVLRFGEVVDKARGERRYGRIDEEHFINRRTTIRNQQQYTLSKTGGNTSASNSTGKNRRNFEVGAQSSFIGTHGTAKYFIPTYRKRMVARNAG